MFTPRLAPVGPPDSPPPAEAVPPVPFGPCDANASGAEDAVVRLCGPSGPDGRTRLLELCGHHFYGLEFELAAGGWQVIWDARPDPLPPRA